MASLMNRIAFFMLCLDFSWSATGVAGEPQILDCPLRDQPYSIELPLIEILLKPEALEVVESHLEGLVDKMPSGITGTQTPSFATIISLRSVAEMFQAGPEILDALEAELGDLEVTDRDRQARCARYENEVPEFEFAEAEVNVLVFDRIVGFDHGPAVDAASQAIRSLGEQMGWYVAISVKPGAFTPESLARFDAVVWNNVSGDVLTLSQRRALEDYINNGGGFLGIHGSGGDPLYLWDWYADTLLGARFIGHPMAPHFQDAIIEMEAAANGIADGLPASWTLKDEWYSFGNNPRESGGTVVATIDEASYSPGVVAGKSLRMGDDHPIAWTRCVKRGRAMYTAIGHRPEVYHIPENLLLLRNGLVWVAGKGKTNCPVVQ